MLTHAFRSICNWRRYRRNLLALSRLDDRTLRDIGLPRSAIPHAARQIGK